MKVLEGYSLRHLNTLGFESTADKFVVVDSESQLKIFLKSRESNLPLLVLGGGSNIVCLRHIPGYVLQPELKGISLLEEDDQHCIVEAMAAEVWDDFVGRCVESGWYGLENLSLIPGTVGASPIQNIGAYGVELKEYFHGLTAIELQTGEEKTFDLQQCQFGYRDSIFKRELKNQYVITKVRFRLNKLDAPCLEYRDLQLKAAASSKPVNAAVVREWVIAIRSVKLPDPKVLGNAGSFFKNAVVSEKKWQDLKAEFPKLPGYPQQDSRYKLPSAWLIDQLGWKGYRTGAIGVHDKQALVLIHNPFEVPDAPADGAEESTGRDLLDLADRIRNDVMARYGVELEIEPSVVGVER